MQIPLPTQLEDRLSPAEAALHLALGLYLDRRVTLGQGAEVAGISTPAFVAELGKLKIPIHYDMEDAIADIATVDRITHR
jgi:predicted HTH domain antitoxin